MKNMKRTFSKKVVALMVVVAVLAAYLPATATVKAAGSTLLNGNFEDATNTAWVYDDNTTVPMQSVVSKTETKEYVENGDFEAGMPSLSVSDATMNRVQDTTGNYYLQLASTNVSNKQIVYSLDGTDTAKVYTISFRAKSSLPLNNNWNGYMEAARATMVETIKATGTDEDGWTSYSGKFTKLYSNQDAMFVVWMKPDMDVLIDDISITSEEPMVKIDVTDYIANGDFENTPYPFTSASNADLKIIEDTNGNHYMELQANSASAGQNRQVTYSYVPEDDNVEHTLSFRVRSAAQINNGWNGYFAKYGELVQAVKAGATDAEGFITYTAKFKGELLFVYFTKDMTNQFDDFRIYTEKITEVKEYTEGIGTCNEAEPNKVLTMKNKGEVKQALSLTKGETYNYSFEVKANEAQADLAVSVKYGSTQKAVESVGSDWATVRGSFVADGNDSFGFVKTGTGEVLIDNVVLSMVEPKPITGGMTTGEWLYADDTAVPMQTLVSVMEDKEYVENGDFEIASPAFDLQNGTTLQRGVEEDGNHYLKLIGNGGTENKQIVYYLNPDTNTERVYTIRFRLSGKIGIDGVGAYLNGDRAVMVEAIKTAGTDANGWTTYTAKFTKKVAGSPALFVLYMPQETDVWMDDLSITSEEPKVVTEATDYVANGDFENAPYPFTTASGSALTISEGSNGNHYMELRDNGGEGNKQVTYSYTPQDAGVEHVLSFRVKSETVINNRWNAYFAGNPTLTQAIKAGATDAEGYITYTAKFKGNILFVYWTQQGVNNFFDDFRIYTENTYEVKEYTEGIGTCNGAESDNVLTMKEKTAVKQNATLLSGATYAYSFKVRGIGMGYNFAFGVQGGAYTKAVENVGTEWTTVTGSFAVPEDGATFGFYRSGTGEVLIDDVELTMISTFGVQAGKVYNTLDRDGAEGAKINFVNIEMSEGSLDALPTGAYKVDLVKAADYIDFCGLSVEELNNYGVTIYLHKVTNGGVFQINWGALNNTNLSDNTTISLKKGLPVTFKKSADETNYVELLDATYTFVVNHSSAGKNGLAITTTKLAGNQAVCDFDGDGDIDAMDVRCCRMGYIDVLNFPTEVADCNGDTKVDVLDLIGFVKQQQGL